MRVHTFKLGRGLDQDLRINDISVSRYHAQIKFLKDRFILLDNLSKFGTLVMIKKGLEIYPG
jgi:pSer/pThr/pTyr-binding forkhead associated (FHA) protein